MLNENIKALRKAKGYSQEELAIKLNVVRQTVSKWEKGLSVPDAGMLIHIAEALDTSVNVLLNAEEPPESEQEVLKTLAAKLELLNEQFAKRNERSRKLWRTLFIAVGIIGLLSVIRCIISAVQLIGIEQTFDAATSIIGGADGPTAIFVARSVLTEIPIVFTAAAIIIAAVGLYKTRKK
ncbi:MAG: helix-turn-helix domain-containing protein [Oscillospiraceae bacterium]|nr:helix-turn-helix domain-containing protein [Oscillospiraceae bacterium]